MISARDVMQIAGYAGLAAVLGVAVGRVLLARWAPQRSLRAGLLVVIGMPVLVMSVGVATAATLMVVSGDALMILLFVVLAGAGAAAVVGTVLASRVEQSSSALGESVRRLADGSTVYEAAPPATRELAALSDQLDQTRIRLEEARERERAAEAGRRELVAWVSHDLRAPLTAVRAMVEAMEDEVVSDPQTVREYHRQIRQQIDRLTRMVGDLFDLSRITAGALELSPRPVSMKALVDDVIASCQSAAEGRGVVLETLLDNNHELVANVDARYLNRALANLVTNAVQHTPPQGVVSIACSANSDRLVVSVSDGCGGIPDHDLPRLFDTGFRGALARTPRDDTGAGLGLAIVRGIVEAHAGTIAVMNIEGGCRFDLHLPHRAHHDQKLTV